MHPKRRPLLVAVTDATAPSPPDPAYARQTASAS